MIALKLNLIKGAVLAPKYISLFENSFKNNCLANKMRVNRKK